MSGGLSFEDRVDAVVKEALGGNWQYLSGDRRRWVCEGVRRLVNEEVEKISLSGPEPKIDVARARLAEQVVAVGQQLQRMTHRERRTNLTLLWNALDDLANVRRGEKT